MSTKDHKVVISKANGTKKTVWATEREARRLEDLPFKDRTVLVVTVTPPR